MRDILIGKDRVSVAGLIGQGGEGAVYALSQRSDRAVKIYKDILRSKREAKVRAMVREGLSAKTNLVAYPDEVVTDLSGKFLGFVMRLVSGYRPMHELYSPKSRQRYFAASDYRFIVRAALNVTRAVGKVHQTGCIIGDLNHSGVLVAQDSTVALIDADSFQFSVNGKHFPCVVGVPDFTPPELHGQNLSSVGRTIQHDNFGLAVAIFQLLFMGRHPYSGLYKGPDISMGEAIAQNRFAFSLTRQRVTQTTPPPGALTLGLYPDNVIDAFENAFGLNPSRRPSAQDWIGVLEKLERSLRQCRKVKTHYFSAKAKSCVWCHLTGNSGFDMFPDLSSVVSAGRSDTQGTEQAIREILVFRFPDVADVLPKVTFQGSPSKAAQDSLGGGLSFSFMGMLLMVAAVAGVIYAGKFWLIWAGLGIWGWNLFGKPAVDVSPFQNSYKEASNRVQQELHSFVRRSGLIEVVKVRSNLDAVIAAYKGHDDALARELRSFKSNRELRQRTAFLDRFSIRDASISGVGPAKTAVLISFGIETAADVNRSAVLRVPGFGQVTTGKLLAWRQKHESGFKYDRVPNAQDVSDERALRARYAADKAKLDLDLRAGLNTLRNAKPRLDAMAGKASRERALIEALEERARAELDLKTLGAFVPVSILTLTPN